MERGQGPFHKDHPRNGCGAPDDRIPDLPYRNGNTETGNHFAKSEAGGDQMTQPEIDFKNGYFNTTSEKSDTLKKYEEIAGEQERKVLQFFRKYPSQLSPSEVLTLFIDVHGYLNIPLTSIRRAITNLTDRGYLTKTDIKHKGLYGRDEYIWELKVTQ
jgi:hypothetical protein